MGRFVRMWMAPRVGGRDHPASDVASKIAFNRLRRSLISRDPGIGPSSRWLRNIADIASPFELRRSPTTVRVTLGAWPRNSHAGARPRRRGDRMTRRLPARWHADKFSGGLNSRPATNCRRFTTIRNGARLMAANWLLRGRGAVALTKNESSGVTI